MAQIHNEIIDKVQIFLRRLKESGISVEAAYLFGSHAGNRAGRWSDIDVAIVSSDFTHDRLDERIRLMRLSADIDSRIEPVPFHSNDFVASDPIVGEIMKNGISIN